MELTIDNVVNSKCYVGGLKKYANPKTRDYWLDVKNDLVVFNPEKIVEQFKNAREKIQQYKKDGKEILLISDKNLFGDEIKELAEKENIHYFNYNIPAGALTNFDTIITRIDSMNKLKDFMDTEEYENLTKKERLSKVRELRKLENVYKGVKSLKRKPDVVIIVDGSYLKSFVEEVEKLGLDNVILASSDFDKRWEEDNLVMTNVNSYKSLKTTLEFILQSS